MRPLIQARLVHKTSIVEDIHVNYFLGLIMGYVVHDALKPTAVGRVLDKVSLPGDLLVKSAEPSANEDPSP